MQDVKTLLDQAIALHSRGERSAATSAYQHILQLQPNHAVALHHLAIIELANNHLIEAKKLLEQAIEAAPQAAGPHFHLGELAKQQGRLADAIVSYQNAIARDSKLAVAYQSLAQVFTTQKKYAQAVDQFKVLIQLAPTNAAAHLQLGEALGELGQLEQAAQAFQQATQLAPNVARPWILLGQTQLGLRRYLPAVESLERAIQLDPNDGGIHSLLGLALDKTDRHQQSLQHHRRAVELLPQSPGAQINFALALQAANRPGEAESHLRTAINLDPKNSEAHANLADVLRGLSRQPEATALFRRAVELAPDSPKAGGMLLYALHFDPTISADQLAAEHRQWIHRHARSIKPTRIAASPERHPTRRLRLGYVSPDFRQHVVGNFLEPIMGCHDRTRFELFAYSDVPVPDAVTQRISKCVDHWHETGGDSDLQLAQRIAQDQIDILIDVTGHMNGSRLLTFAHRPAPVQISHIGYPASPGLPAIGFRITDRHLDPPQSQPAGQDETLLLMPNSFYLYNPPSFASACQPAPIQSAKHPVFGCLNAPAKTTPAAIELWSAVLRRLPHSRLMLVVAPDGSANDYLIRQFAAHGIESSRLILEPMRPVQDYLALYHRIDIALDPQPYGGGITTCDALWMGVPVIALQGHTSVGRIAGSILHTLNLGDLVALSPDAYADLAAKLAEDLPRLAHLRSQLRPMLANFPLTDAKTYTRDLENLYLQAWSTPQKRKTPDINPGL